MEDPFHPYEQFLFNTQMNLGFNVEMICPNYK